MESEDEFEIFLNPDDGPSSNNSSFSSNTATPTRKVNKNKRTSKSQNDSNSGPPKKKVFQHKWTELEAFTGWLAPVKGKPHRAACTACPAEFDLGKSEAEKHAAGAKHQIKVKSIQNTPTITQKFAAQAQSVSSKHKEAVKSAGIRLSAFFAEHNVAVSVVEHLTPVIQKAFKDSPTAQDVTLGRTKCTKMMKNVVGKVETDDVVANVIAVPCYSVMIDGSTDHTSKKFMCVLVKYCSVHEGAVTRLLELVCLDARDCSAQAQFDALSKCLYDKGISMYKIIGFGSDNENTMTGEHNSVWSRIRDVASHAVLVGCNCHSAASSAGVACCKLPPHLDDIISKIYNYIKGSGKRQTNLEEFQEF
ncbi:SCAN domain-containing protein 3 [Frankliniella fusca]|uniref:SCAN domain-containing protein 3 n=1 Tax=Frankliniella fusca TaxID=407009 RepID=A0AAE1H4L0_9NEOP|nr:SCAN domain-containing protein 3 [Frankliniella fusca]